MARTFRFDLPEPQRVNKWLAQQGVKDIEDKFGGTAYAFCGNNWWSYDTPSTIAGKMTYAKNQGLGCAFFWELSGDTTNGELISAIKSNL